MTLTPPQLQSLLERIARLHILVVGDLFLDKYLVLDRHLSKTSLETGLEAYQVVEVRAVPGAAGTVAKAVAALGARADILAVVGTDGEGHDLRGALRKLGAGHRHLLARPDRYTPTYLKPLMREPDGHEHELNRMDIEPRSPLPSPVQAELCARLEGLAGQVDGVAVVDQVEAPDCGVITAQVRWCLAGLARAHPRVVFLADSRTRVGWFQSMIVKPNLREAAAAAGEETAGEVDPGRVRRWAAELLRRTGRPVFITAGEHGLFAFDGRKLHHQPAVPVSGPVDPVGAGDTAMAAIVGALCVGASPAQAAELASLAAAVTVAKLGTTGEPTPEEILALRTGR
ncbi:MAG: bifunctional heptose 7-phosphate kinase/heptose 1-phosphate adenyltransferase [Candidatus Bipolaricaulaceae bacterium]